MSLSAADLASIVAALQESDWDEAEVVIGDVRIAVARNGARLSDGGAPAAAPAAPAPAPIAAPDPAPVAAPASAAPAPASAAPAGPTTAGTAGAGDYAVTAPSVGVFWRSPEPGAAPFVEVGQRVNAGDTIGIVEIMKLMNNVSSVVSGTVTAVHIENGGAVEFGTALVSIAADGA